MNEALYHILGVVFLVLLSTGPMVALAMHASSEEADESPTVLMAALTILIEIEVVMLCAILDTEGRLIRVYLASLVVAAPVVYFAWMSLLNTKQRSLRAQKRNAINRHAATESADRLLSSLVGK